MTKRVVIKHIIAVLSFAILSMSYYTNASEHEQYNSGGYLLGGLGYYFFDSDRDVDDDALGSVAIGYQFASPWAMELLYLKADTDADSGIDVDTEQWRIDALYHYTRRGNWQPYAGIGVGMMETEFNGSDHDASIVDLGAGVKYRFSPALSLRSDLRLINSLDDEMTDAALTFSLSYLFGQKRQPSSTVAATAEPTTPAATTPAQPLDSDNDGIADIFDQCPNTQAGVPVDQTGCLLDDDRDGIANSVDQCPDTSVGAKVNQYGCYVMLTETKEVQLSINFANNSADINEADYPEIESVAKFMTEFASTNVVIEGHTDDRGNADYNLQLSQRRAKAVAEVLINEYSIARSRVSAVGYGEQRPIASNNTAASRAQNRRVIAVVKATTQSIQRQ